MNMIKKTLAGSVLVSVIILINSAAAYASDITYTIDQTIGVGSVVGTVETNGTLGSLSDANILNWDLTLNDGTGPFTLLGPLSGNNSALDITGSSLTATSTNLLFNFSNTSTAWVLFQNPSIPSSINFWCLDGTFDSCSGNVSAETVTTSGPFAAVHNSLAGVVSVGTTTPVPLPASVWLVLSGFGGLMLMRKRRAA